jgi:hypothetical protein
MKKNHPQKPYETICSMGHVDKKNILQEMRKCLGCKLKWPRDTTWDTWKARGKPGI